MKKTTKRPTRRGELIPDLPTLTDAQIAERIKGLVFVDQELRDALNKITGERDADAVKTYRNFLDVALASIVCADERIEARWYIQRVQTRRRHV